MARSTYISENLTQKQIDFMLLLDDYELDIFTLEEVKAQLGDKVDNISELIENLVNKRIFSRIERGKYCRYNFRDENIIGSFLVSDGVISYWSALHKHGLTEQFPNSVFVQTSKAKKDKTVFGVYYKFVKVISSKQTGIIEEGFGNHKFRITTIEKTIADCFDLPQYCGGYAELIRAFNEASMNSKNLIAACKAIHNIAATKRMGYLAALLEKRELADFIQYAESQTKEKYNLFDPAGEEEGEFVNSWKLRLNITKEDILSIVNKIY
tara:strand:- start:365 stop:1165 length:801 start_codon:yes stop_codon:yes gene_type:complete